MGKNQGHNHTQKRTRVARKKIIFSSVEDAVNRLKRFGAKESNGVLYIKDRVGLKVLGAVDYLNSMRESNKKTPFIVFGKGA